MRSHYERNEDEGQEEKKTSIVTLKLWMKISVYEKEWEEKRNWKKEKDIKGKELVKYNSLQYGIFMK